MDVFFRIHRFKAGLIVLDMMQDDRWDMVKEYRSQFTDNHVVNPAKYMDWALNHGIMCGAVCTSFRIRGIVVALILKSIHKDDKMRIPSEICRSVARIAKGHDVNIIKVHVDDEGHITMWA